MALTYLQEGMTRPATFSLFTRNLPPDRGFLVAAGLEDALAYLERLRVDDSDVAALASALGRPDDEVTALRDLHFTGDVWAVPEGRVVLAGEPLLEVTAPLPQAHLVETFLLNQLTYQTATSRCAAPTAPSQGCTRPGPAPWSGSPVPATSRCRWPTACRPSAPWRIRSSRRSPTKVRHFARSFATRADR
jgi:nicotinic acid phosphoribosyltransferase